MTDQSRTSFLRSAFTKATAAMTAAPAGLKAATGAAAGLGIGALTFTNSWMLAGFAALPPLWWLMRTIPPKPQEAPLPSMRFLLGLRDTDQEPARMPLWHRVMRMTALSLLITGLSGPRLNPDELLEGNGPVVMVVDNGWAAARNWPARQIKMKSLLDTAEKSGRPVIVLETAAAPGADLPARREGTAAQIRQAVTDMKPQPWAADRRAALEKIRDFKPEKPASVVWLSDGLDDPGARDMATALQKIGKVTVLQDDPALAPRLLVPPDGSNDKLAVTVRRTTFEKDGTVLLTAHDEAGRALEQIKVPLVAGQAETKAVFDVPPAMRTQLTRISIEGDNSAGATVLLDERWRRRPVGLVVSGTTESMSALLSESNFIARAVEPYVDLRNGDVEQLLKGQLAVMILPDSVVLNGQTQTQIGEWVKAGGTLLRFAGPQMAARGDTEKDPLLPVTLQPGVRALGGGLRGTGAGSIKSFSEGTPLAGLKGRPDINVDRQILARPGPETESRTWARLSDGTPLITADKRGKGTVVLVHTTANADWSNLSLSGLFIDTMRAIVAHSQGVSGAVTGSEAPLPPLRVLDGRGKLVSPFAGAQALPAGEATKAGVGPRTPPGFYGNESTRQAHNLAPAVAPPQPLPALPEGIGRKIYETGAGEDDLSGSLLGGALALALVDMMIALSQRGLLPRLRREDSPSKPVAVGAGPKPT